MSLTDAAPESRAIPTTMRLLAILEAVAAAGRPVTPTDVNAALGLPKPTIHRLFQTLEVEGFLQRGVDGRTYLPGRRLRGLASGVVASSGLRAGRLAVLNRLSARLGETVNMAVPDGDAMVYAERVESTWPLRIQLPVGTRVPLAATASGKMYLASLPEAEFARALHALLPKPFTAATLTGVDALAEDVALTRSRGWAEDAGEFLEGMVAVAVPVQDGAGRLVSTLSLHAPTLRMSLAEARVEVPRLREAAAELEAQMVL